MMKPTILIVLVLLGFALSGSPLDAQAPTTQPSPTLSSFTVTGSNSATGWSGTASFTVSTSPNGNVALAGSWGLNTPRGQGVGSLPTRTGPAPNGNFEFWWSTPSTGQAPFTIVLTVTPTKKSVSVYAPPGANTPVLVMR